MTVSLRHSSRFALIAIVLAVLTALSAVLIYTAAAPASAAAHSHARHGKVTHSRTSSVRGAIKLQAHLRKSTRHGSTQPPAESEPAPEPAPAPSPSPSPSPSPEEQPTEAVAPSEPVAPAPTSSGGVTIPADARYVSASTGNDSNSGSASAPWRTLAKAVASVNPGDVVVLEPGTYGGFGVTTTFSRSGTATAPIAFTSQPGAARAVIHGYVRITASNLHLDSLVFDGPTGGIVAPTTENPGGQEVQVSIMSTSNVELSNSEVRDNAWHAGVFVSRSTGVHIVSNYIHNNGDAATGANMDHGVYWCSGSGTVTNNRIEANVAYGVQLYPTATEVTVSHNTIDGNKRGGVIVSREAARNQVNNNIVANNAQYGIRSYELTGTGNVANDNLLWNNGQNTYGSGITFSGSLIKDPKTLTASVLSAYGAS